MWTSRRATVATSRSIFKAEKRKQVSRRRRRLRDDAPGESQIDDRTALYVLALISLSLGVINLFPFLPLDGGHIFWALAEKVRGKAIPFASWSAPASSASRS